MKWKPYPRYKDAGIAWLGEVPSEWPVAAVGYRYEVALGKMLDQKRVTGDHLAPYLRNVDVQWDAINTEDLPEMDFAPEERVRYRLDSGDLVACEGGEVGRAAIWDGQISDCYYQKALHRLRPHQRNRDLPRFMLYLLWAAASQGRFAVSEGRSTIAHLTAEALRTYRFAFPTLDEQVDVVRYLDRETAKLDTLIAKQERLIELLQEKRQALISYAVTKGLNPDAPMKDSGVEWLGEVPAHWTCVRLSYVSAVNNGTTPDRNRMDYWEGTIPWLSSGKVNDFVITEADEFVSDSAIRETCLRLIPTRSVLVGLIGQGRTRGMAALMGIEACINQNVAAIVPGPGLDPVYLLFTMTAAYLPLRETGRGGQQDALNCEMLGAFRLPFPSIDEQSRISTYLWSAVSRIDQLIDRSRRSIELMREHRSALISAAVTGKIDVRNDRYLNE